MLLAAVLALAAVTTGCGSDDDEASAEVLTTSALAKNAYVQKVSAICKKTNEGMLESLVKYGEAHPQGDREEVARRAVVNTVPPALDREVDAIRELGAPSGDAKKVEAYLDAVEAATRAIEEKPPTDIFKLQAALEPVNRPALAYGLDGCKF
jgi:hypothetical protein